MVRAGEDVFLISDFKKKNYVSIGWNKIGDLSDIKQKEKIKELVEQTYRDFKSSKLRSITWQVSSFKFDFEREDYVISYDTKNRIYIVCEIQSDYRHNPEKKWISSSSNC